MFHIFHLYVGYLTQTDKDSLRGIMHKRFKEGPEEEEQRGHNIRNTCELPHARTRQPDRTISLTSHVVV